MLVQAEVGRLSLEAAELLGEAAESSGSSGPNVPDPPAEPVTSEDAAASREESEALVAEPFQVEDPTNATHGHEEDGENATRRRVGFLPEGTPNGTKETKRRRKEQPCARKGRCA
jgi:hypothetical protein